MIFKYELRFVASTWPNHCLWVVILCPALIFVSENLRNLKNVFLRKKTCFTSPTPNFGLGRPAVYSAGRNLRIATSTATVIVLRVLHISHYISMLWMEVHDCVNVSGY